MSLVLHWLHTPKSDYRPWQVLHPSDYTLTPHSAQRWHSRANNPKWLTDRFANTLPAVQFCLLTNSFMMKLCRTKAETNHVGTQLLPASNYWHWWKWKHAYHTLPFLRTELEYMCMYKSHWVKSENSQSPLSESLKILKLLLKDTYSFKTANTSHASQAAPHSAGTLLMEAITQCECWKYKWVNKDMNDRKNSFLL